MEIKFPDLNKSEELKEPLKRFSMDLEDDLKINSGDLVMQESVELRGTTCLIFYGV